jgi:polysaccharide biosynthesis transport protein
MNFSQFIRILSARYKVFLLTLFVTMAITLTVSLIIPKTYKATATLLLNYKGVDPVTGTILSPLFMPGFMATQADVINSETTASMVAKKLKLEQNESIRQQYEESNPDIDFNHWLINELLRKNLEVYPSRESSVISISYKGKDPVFVAAMANAYSNIYQELSIKLSVEPSQHAASYFGNQIEVLRDKLEIAHEKLSQYRQTKGVVNIDENLDVELRQLNELSSQLVLAQAELSKSTPEQISKNLNNKNLDVSANTFIDNLKTKLAEAESKFADVSENLGSNHPSYVGARAEVQKLRMELNRHIKSAMDNSLNRVSNIRKALEDKKDKVLALNQTRDRIHLLAKEIDGIQQAYDNAMERLNQASLEGQANLSSVSLLDPAIPPAKHSSPNIRINVLLSIFLGTILGLATALFMEMFDRRVRSAEDLVTALKAPVFGVIKLKKPKPLLRLSWSRSTQ